VRIVLWAGLALMTGAPAAGGILSAAGAREVVVVSPHSREAVAMNRLLWTRGERVPELYGIPHGSMRLLFPSSRRLVTPEEDPSITLFLLEPEERPFQERTLWFFVRWSMITGLLLVVAAAAVRTFARRSA
jgi:hypothetical protein